MNMKKYLLSVVFLAFVSIVSFANASVSYNQSVSLTPGWNIISTPRILDSHTFSLPETSNNFDIYVLNASSTDGWSTMADLEQTEFTPLYGYFINNKSTTTQTLIFNYGASTTPNQRFFSRTFSSAGWYSIGIANPTYADPVTDASTNTNNPSSILNSLSGDYDSVVDLTASSSNINSVSVSDKWQTAIPSDVNSLNDFRETKGYAIYITQPGASYIGTQNNDIPATTTSSSTTAYVNISLDSSSPQQSQVAVTDTTNGQYLKLPVLIFDVNAQNDAVHLHNLAINVATSGTQGTVTAAYLYQGSTQVASAAVSGGVATFSNITDGTQGALVAVNSTLPYTVKVDVTGVLTGNLTVIASTSDFVFYDSSDKTVTTINGLAVGNTQKVVGLGLQVALNSANLVKTVGPSDTSGNATTTYSGTFNLNLSAVGTDATFGLLSSSTPSFATSTSFVTVYANGAKDTSTNYLLTVNYSQSTGTTLSGDSKSFTLGRNNNVTIPVTYTFAVLNPGVNTYAVQFEGISVNTSQGNQLINFMQDLSSWRTNVQ